MSLRRTSRLACAALALNVALASTGRAAEARIALELNKLEPAGPACRAYLALKSDLNVTLESLTLDLVLFDAEGVVFRRVAVETGPLRAGKSAVRAFDIADAQCDALSRMLLNGVLTCAGAEGPHAGCLELIDVSSRTAAPLID